MQTRPSKPCGIRDVISSDLAQLRTLNEAALPNVNSIDIERFSWFARHAAYFRTVDRSAEPVGFLIALTAEAPYESANFLWFRARYDRYVYIDRVVIASTERRAGLGALLYRDLELFSRRCAPRLTCEVNLRPPNPGSLRFHEALGFHQVGTQETEGGTKEVALMVKEIGP